MKEDLHNVRNVSQGFKAEKLNEILESSETGPQDEVLKDLQDYQLPEGLNGLMNIT